MFTVDTSLMKLVSVLSRVPTLRNLLLPKLSLEGIAILCQWLPTCQLKTLTIHENTEAQKVIIIFCNNYIEAIECQDCTTEFIDQISSQIPQQSIAPIQAFTLLKSTDPPLLPFLSEFIPRMNRLNTLTLKYVHDSSLTRLIPVLSRIPTLRNLTLSKLNSESITLLCQWLPTCQLETLTLHVPHSNELTITFCNNSINTIESQNCTTQFINQILSQLSLANVGTLTICYASYSHQLLPPCLSELILTMERLNTLTLKNVLDTSLTELIPTLSRVPTLRNLTLHELNSEGIALLCQWIPTCQLEEFTVHEKTEGQKIITLFCNNSIEAIDCHRCTTEFIDQVLSQLPQQTLTHVKTLKIHSELHLPQPLPPCLLELLPRMKRLNTLVLIETLGSSVTEIIPVLLRAPTLRNLTLHELNSEAIGLLCQWQSALQLEQLQLLDSKLYEVDKEQYYHSIILRSERTKSICGSFFETIEWYSCTEEFVIHVQLQQLALHAKSIRIEYHPMQPIPPCLIQMIPKMKRLNTLTLKNVLDTSLTELIPVLSRVPNLRNLTLPKLNSEGITLCLCQWLPTCQLETLTLHEQTETLPPKKVTINFCNNLSEAIDCHHCTTEFVDQILTQIPQQFIKHVKTLEICGDSNLSQLLPPCLPDLVSTMEKLSTLTLKNVLDTSLTELIPIRLSKVDTLRNLTLHKLNSEGLTLLCQWLSSCQLETLTLHEQIETDVNHQITIIFRTNFIEAIECQYCTKEFIDEVLKLLSLQSTVRVIICNDIGDNQLLPACLPELIPRMEKLSALTLKNVHDTSLTALIPALSRVPTLRNLRTRSDSGNFEMLFPTDSLPSTGTINAYCTPKLLGMFLPQLPQQILAHIESLTVTYSYSQEGSQPLPSCLPELVLTMERLNTLILKNVLDTSPIELIPVLSKISTLRRLTLHELNSEGITLLCQWLPTCQLETLTLHEQAKTLATHKITVNFCSNFMKAIECQYCTTEFLDQVLLQIPQQSITHIQAFTIWNEINHSQALPPSLPKIIPTMEGLNTLTLKNVLDTSLTELIPALSRVPTLRNLTLHELNSEGIALLCQWIPTCQLEEFTVHEKTEGQKIVTLFCNNSIEAIDCHCCTTEFIDQILSQLPQQTLTHVKTLEICSEPHLPQPLPPCLPELLPRMKRLNTLILIETLGSSVTEIIPVLLRVPTLRNLTLHELNSEAIGLLCQWQSAFQLEQLHLFDSKLYEINGRQYYHNIILRSERTNGICGSFFETIECYSCTEEFIIHVQLQQLAIHAKSISIEYRPMQQLPPCLIQMIPKMKRLNTLTLKNVLDTSLAELTPVLSRVPTLRNLTLHELNSEGIALLCQWILTCQLEEFTVHEKTEGQKIITLFCNNSIEAIDCHCCTTEFIDQILSQLPQQTLKTLKICSEPYLPQPLPPCLLELLPRMKRLNTLVLIETLGSSVTEIIPVLLRVPTLKNLTLHELNSEAIGLLCQWQSALQLEQLQLLDSKLYEIDGEQYYHNITLRSERTICCSSFETIECYSCTEEFVIHVQLQQLALHAKSIRIEYHPMQPIPPCLVQLICRMERLNTLILENIPGTSLIALLPALSRVPTLRNLRIQSDSGNFEMLFPTDRLFPTGTINGNCLAKLIRIILPQIPQQTIAHIRSLTVTCWYSQENPQSLPLCIPELLPKMERLSTLTLENVLDTALTELMPVLSKVTALRDLTLHKLNSEGFTLLCQWLPTCQLETLTLYEQIESHKIMVNFCGNSIETIECQYCTTEFIDQILSLLPQHSIVRIKTLTVYNKFDHPQSLPPCLSEVMPKMKKLNMLTLKNVLDTSLTELIPVLSEVPTLRNLTLHKLNLEGITLLCQWLPKCQLETLTLHEQIEQIESHKITITFCSNFIEAIECQVCTKEFINQILLLLSQQSATHVVICNDFGHYQPLPLCLPELIPRMGKLSTLTLKNVLDTSLTELVPALSRLPNLRNLKIQSDSGNLQMLFCKASLLSTISGTQKLLGMFLQQLAQQILAHIESLTVTYSYSKEGPQPLLSCLPELIPKMERLNKLTLKGVLDTSLTELMPVLSRVPTLRNLTLHELNSENNALLCQWLPTCQLETLTLHQHNESIVKPRVIITFCNNSIEAIEWQHCRTELIDQFLSQIPQQSTVCIRILKISNDQPQQLPAPIQGMEQLNTLHCLYKLNSEGIAHLCQWLPTCQLETLTLHSLSPDHSVMVCKALTSVSSLKTLDIQDSEFMTFLSMQALVSMLQQNQSLTDLALTYCNIGSDSVHCLAEALYHNTTLKRLVMLGNPVGEREALTMAEMLKYNSTLKEFGFIGANICRDGITCLVEALHHNTTLRKLDMRGNSIGERGAHAMAEMLKHNTTLKELYLSHTEISSDGAGAIGNALHSNTTLKKLNMSGNPVGERGALAMAEMLKNNTTLEELNLFMAQIGNDGAVTMAEALHLNTTLRKLDMSGNPVREKGALAIAEMLKHNTTLEEVDLRF